MSNQIVPLSRCSFRKETGTLYLSSEFFAGGFPEVVEIKSHHSGAIVRFVKDHETAERCEWWDGECYEYVPVDPTNNCKRLVVNHEY